MTRSRQKRASYLAGYYERGDAMLEQYERAKVEGRKLTLEMLGEDAGVSIARISQILAAARKRRAARLQAAPV